MITSDLTAQHLENKIILGPAYGSGVQGTGLITYIAMGLCNVLGITCDMYRDKINMAVNSALENLNENASSTYYKPSGIMDLKFQLSGTTVLASGLVYSEERQNIKPPEKPQSVAGYEIPANINSEDLKTQIKKMSDYDLELILNDQKELYNKEEILIIEKELTSRYKDK